MSIVYGIDSSHPFTSAIRAAYAQEDGETVAEAFAKQVNGEEEANQLYGRYWHGSMVYLRPLMLLFDLQEMRIVVGVVIVLLQLLILLRLWQMGSRPVMACYLLAFLLIGPWMLFACLEYSAVFLVMSAATLVMLRLIRQSREEGAFVLFAVAGVTTCFVDFLTAETLTYTVPMLFLLVHLADRGSLNSMREGLRKVMAGGLWWLAGYASAFAAKLLLVFAVCGESELAASLEAGAVRVGGQVHLGNTNLDPEASIAQRLGGAIWHNLSPLAFAEYDDMTMAGALLPALAVVVAAVILIYLFHQNLTAGVLAPLAVLALLPYLRFLALSNHAYLHFFFTYRAQLVTLTALFYLTWAHGLQPALQALGTSRQKRPGSAGKLGNGSKKAAASASGSGQKKSSPKKGKRTQRNAKSGKRRR